MENSKILLEGEKASNMIITDAPNKDINYGRQSILYPLVLLDKQRRCHFITIPQTTIEQSDLNEMVQTISKTLRYSITAQEKHKDGNKHYHICLSFKSPISVKQIHNKILSLEGQIAGSINYQEVKEIHKVINYIKKDNNYKETGEAPKQANTKVSSQELLNTDLSSIYNSELDTNDALEIIKQQQPAFYTQHQDKIKNVLQQRDQPQRLKWEYKTYTSQNTTLKPYQQRVWDLINTTPKTRQIIWVYGKPNSGKSFLFNYINENYKYGLYSAGQSASLDNVVYGYDEEGVIAWDIPKSFDFNQMGDALASTIEKFSDFGQTLTSKKYNGKKARVLGHALVFSNHPPLEQLSHREVILINTTDIYENVKTKMVNNKPVFQITKGDTTIYKYSQEDLDQYIQQDTYIDDSF